MRGDGCLVYGKRGCDIPALWTETESNGDFPCTINKTIRGVIAQFRLLRCYSPNIMECKGFAFPVTKNAVVTRQCAMEGPFISCAVRNAGKVSG